MIKRLLFVLITFISLSSAIAQKIQSPDEFLGYKLGDQFTPHYRIVDYFKYVAQVSKNVKLQQFGTTNEGRPLLAVFIASDANIGRLEEIRHNNLRLAGMEKGSVIANMPVITWLSYNVHGNEPASSEAAMWTLFDMVDPSNTTTKAWLKNTVVVIDPCLNPDGRDRYINFYNSVHGEVPDANPISREHVEPWPGGRTNHFYFDLNRDWAWQTQKETQARVALFNQWLPEVHVDYHEQGYNAPYYFAPAAEPYHKDITQWQRDFQVIIGKNNAKYFDQNGWMYFTKQEFDLLYPSYGDTYPLYNGSIGMTYEQGGISAGLAVLTRSGDTLTLAQRIAHHHTTALGTVEIASANAQKLLDEFKKFYDNSRINPPGIYKTYIIKNDNHNNINALAGMLTRNGIQYGFGLNDKTIIGFDYFTGKTEQYKVGADDMVINAHQPKAVLLHVLLEPKTFIADSNTYDITAWALPYAYGLKAYGVKESLKPASSRQSIAKPQQLINSRAYAYVATWQSVNDVKLLSALLKKGIKVRYSEKAFEAGGKKFMPGSLLITRAGNDGADFDQVVTRTAAELNEGLTSLSSGFVDKGADLGSDAIRYIKRPRVMLIAGEGVNAEAMGEVWHLFEQQIGYPVSLVKYQDLGRTRLADFDVAIFPDGTYDDFPSDKLQNWIRDGGKLIAIENTVAQLADKKGFALKNKEEKKDDKVEEKEKETVKLYGERDRDAIRSMIPGAIFKLNLDNTHPLGFGLPNYYYSLKLNDDIYNLLSNDDGWNVGTIKKNSYVSGFAGAQSKLKINNGLLLGVQSLGRGSVVYMVDDPLFRSFWENGKLLFSNAVFMVQ
ncbi:M14 metallopeptidase family protein [Mucilaginibacter sabulilitoris]|uniref:M14 metallopeptidase family protein n=1 Tax=Mucilaginibacter sabulilitoris TaxID=1173583 RepID=A0ABZ0TMS9_9SPHI|nr:M14 metallopeptidase family protein [Mucilaginibacter sabulilitoris]WPU94469.1 M14 metallopeptidase family protein [Mucilaginibacter sabulilitoris]